MLAATAASAAASQLPLSHIPPLPPQTGPPNPWDGQTHAIAHTFHSIPAGDPSIESVQRQCRRAEFPSTSGQQLSMSMVQGEDVPIAYQQNRFHSEGASPVVSLQRGMAHGRQPPSAASWYDTSGIPHNPQAQHPPPTRPAHVSSTNTSVLMQPITSQLPQTAMDTMPTLQMRISSAFDTHNPIQPTLPSVGHAPNGAHTGLWSSIQHQLQPPNSSTHDPSRSTSMLMPQIFTDKTATLSVPSTAAFDTHNPIQPSFLGQLPQGACAAPLQPPPPPPTHDSSRNTSVLMPQTAKDTIATYVTPAPAPTWPPPDTTSHSHYSLPVPQQLSFPDYQAARQASAPSAPSQRPDILAPTHQLLPAPPFHSSSGDALAPYSVAQPSQLPAPPLQAQPAQLQVGHFHPWPPPPVPQPPPWDLASAQVQAQQTHAQAYAHARAEAQAHADARALAAHALHLHATLSPQLYPASRPDPAPSVGAVGSLPLGGLGASQAHLAQAGLRLVRPAQAPAEPVIDAKPPPTDALFPAPAPDTLIPTPPDPPAAPAPVSLPHSFLSHSLRPPAAPLASPPAPPSRSPKAAPSDATPPAGASSAPATPQAQGRAPVGAGRMCVHRRRSWQCKQCGGSGICPHQRLRYQCRDCGGSQICEHNRRRSHCKACGGSAICEHNKQRQQCKTCSCKHRRRRDQCPECNQDAPKPHGRTDRPASATKAEARSPLPAGPGSGTLRLRAGGRHGGEGAASGGEAAGPAGAAVATAVVPGVLPPGMQGSWTCRTEGRALSDASPSAGASTESVQIR